MYDKFPFIAVSQNREDCVIGWDSIADVMRTRAKGTVCLECYPGVLVDEVCDEIKKRFAKDLLLVRAEDCYLDEAELERRIRPLLTDDPVFGRMNDFAISDFMDAVKVRVARAEIERDGGGLVLVVGTGASLLAPVADLLVYADMARWEIQQRQRRGLVGNLGVRNLAQSAAAKYKRGFFLDWRAADRLKRELLPTIDYLLDTNDRKTPKLISESSFRDGLKRAASRPIRVVPFFDPGPWGGHWMEEVCDLPRDTPNHAWCFDCVPEENSMLLGFGDRRVEIPALDLIFMQTRAVLGEAIESAFGAEFPIRFDLLDTMGGGNLSLQVHPRLQYIREAFGVDYTQDESYYILDAKQNGTVFLGLREDADENAMLHDLRASQQENGVAFDAERYVNRFAAKKHDHFLIPAGTVHCSGQDTLVLEISATPYIFTFKLWDWGRLGLDGNPRPIHLDHGSANIAWDRRAEWVRRNLVNRVEQIAHGDGWREERTGLHELEFIETRRHWFTSAVQHDTGGTVNVLNLVEGEGAIVESPTDSFEPFEVHYAETFIVPAAVGRYTIRPAPGSLKGGGECATVKAFIRTEYVERYRKGRVQ